MEQELIWGLPVMNFQALCGAGLFILTWILVKFIRGIQIGKYPVGAGGLLYLRTLLGFTLMGSLMMFFGAMFGIRYI